MLCNTKHSPFHARLGSIYIFLHYYTLSPSVCCPRKRRKLKTRIPYHVVVQMKVVGVPEWNSSRGIGYQNLWQYSSDRNIFRISISCNNILANKKKTIKKTIYWPVRESLNAWEQPLFEISYTEQPCGHKLYIDMCCCNSLNWKEYRDDQSIEPRTRSSAR